MKGIQKTSYTVLNIENFSIDLRYMTGCPFPLFLFITVREPTQGSKEKINKYNGLALFTYYL